MITFDENKNEITKGITISGVDNISFMIANKAKNRIYLVKETASEMGGKISVFLTIPNQKPGKK